VINDHFVAVLDGILLRIAAAPVGVYAVFKVSVTNNWVAGQTCGHTGSSDEAARQKSSSVHKISLIGLELPSR
jgi:hypothetical protein